MNKRRFGFGVVVLAAVALMSVVSAQGFKNIREYLSGYEEVGSNIGAISTSGTGEFQARIANDGQSIAYELTYSKVEGNVTQAHIHFGQRHTTGGISAWLCTNLGPVPAGPQPPVCPAKAGTVTGVLRPANVVGPAGQGIEPGAFNELVSAIRAGATYVNVHSDKWPSGEIRAQIGDGNEGHGNDHDD